MIFIVCRLVRISPLHFWTPLPVSRPPLKSSLQSGGFWQGDGIFIPTSTEMSGLTVLAYPALGSSTKAVPCCYCWKLKMRSPWGFWFLGLATLGNALMGQAEDLQQIPDGHFAVHRLRQGQVEGDLILIHPSYPLLVHVSGSFEFGDDPADRPLGQPYVCRDVPGRNLAPLRNQEQHRAVVGEETPFWHACPRGFRGCWTTAEKRQQNPAVKSMYS